MATRDSASAKRPRHPSALAPHSALPRSPPVSGEHSFRKDGEIRFHTMVTTGTVPGRTQFELLWANALMPVDGGRMIASWPHLG